MSVWRVAVTLLDNRHKINHSVFLPLLTITHCFPKMRLPNQCSLARCLATKGLGRSQKTHSELNTAD